MERLTTQEHIELLQQIFKADEKKARRYNKLATSYLNKYKHQCERNNETLRRIDNLKNKLQYEKENI